MTHGGSAAREEDRAGLRSGCRSEKDQAGLRSGCPAERRSGGTAKRGTCRKAGTCVIGDDFPGLYERMVRADGLVFVSAVYWHDLTEQFKVLLDRLRRCEALTNHYLKGKSCLLAACAGGTGRGAVNCLWNLEDTLSHMGLKAVDRVPVVQFNRGYMLGALKSAGRTFGDYLAGKVAFPNLP